jgi:hypothetical protein
MSPYFYKLSHSLISDTLKEKIIKLSNEQLDDFVSYKGQRTGKADGNYFYFGKLLNEDPEIVSLISSCTLTCFPIIMLHHPNTKVLRHIDNPNKRNCVLLTPVFPTVNYTPTWFWNPKGPFEGWEEEELTPAATCEFENMNSVILNTQQPHSLQTTDSFRMNFQLCFEDSFEIVVSRVQTNTLFKN